jgi:hypothetical protein
MERQSQIKLYLVQVHLLSVKIKIFIPTNFFFIQLLMQIQSVLIKDCDRKTGECKCFKPFTGAACEKCYLLKTCSPNILLIYNCCLFQF